MPVTKSRAYAGEDVDLGAYVVAFRGGRVHVTNRADGPEPWLEKHGNTIYVVGQPRQKLDIEGPTGLN